MPVLFRLSREANHHCVTCYRDTSNPPKQITNKEGLILLRKNGLTTPSEYLRNISDILCTCRARVVGGFLAKHLPAERRVHCVAIYRHIFVSLTSSI